jgi:hypothetical protein
MSQLGGSYHVSIYVHIYLLRTLVHSKKLRITCFETKEFPSFLDILLAYSFFVMGTVKEVGTPPAAAVVLLLFLSNNWGPN